jgi:hypothetical protein
MAPLARRWHLMLDLEPALSEIGFRCAGVSGGVEFDIADFTAGRRKNG